MKRILSIIVALLAIVAGASAANIQDVAAKTNKNCPFSGGEGLTVTSVTYNPEAKTLDYAIAVDATVVPFDAFALNADMVHDGKVMELMTASDPAEVELRDAVVSSGSSIVYNFVCGPKSMKVTITPDDLK